MQTELKRLFHHLLVFKYTYTVKEVSRSLLFLGSSSPVSPHMQQNGFNGTSANVTASNNVSGNSQTVTTLPQTYTGAGGTWTGSNTLTYTQSMQPPDSRNHHNTYCTTTSV